MALSSVHVDVDEKSGGTEMNTLPGTDMKVVIVHSIGAKSGLVRDILEVREASSAPSPGTHLID